MASQVQRARREELLAVHLLGEAGVLLALSVSFLFQDVATGAWRMTEGLLELAGFSTVAISLARKLRSFSEASPFAKPIRRRLRRAWPWILAKLGRNQKDGSVKISRRAGSVDVSGVVGRIAKRPAGNAEVERWIKCLGEEVEGLKHRVVNSHFGGRRDNGEA